MSRCPTCGRDLLLVVWRKKGKVYHRSRGKTGGYTYTGCSYKFRTVCTGTEVEAVKAGKEPCNWCVL